MGKNGIAISEPPKKRYVLAMTIIGRQPVIPIMVVLRLRITRLIHIIFLVLICPKSIPMDLVPKKESVV